jgi:hypothetical protein
MFNASLFHTHAGAERENIVARYQLQIYVKYGLFDYKVMNFALFLQPFLFEKTEFKL